MNVGHLSKDGLLWMWLLGPCTEMGRSTRITVEARRRLDMRCRMDIRETDLASNHRNFEADRNSLVAAMVKRKDDEHLARE